MLDYDVRKAAGVTGNPFLFASTNKSNQEIHCSGWHELNSICQALDIKGVTATKLRHFTATEIGDTALNQEDKAAVHNHFGHSGTIHNKFYKCPEWVSSILAANNIASVVRGLNNLSQQNMEEPSYEVIETDCSLQIEVSPSSSELATSSPLITEAPTSLFNTTVVESPLSDAAESLLSKDAVTSP